MVYMLMGYQHSMNVGGIKSERVHAQQSLTEGKTYINKETGVSNLQVERVSFTAAGD
jgi:hypothetical protein